VPGGEAQPPPLSPPCSMPREGGCERLPPLAPGVQWVLLAAVLLGFSILEYRNVRGRVQLRALRQAVTKQSMTYRTPLSTQRKQGSGRQCQGQPRAGIASAYVSYLKDLRSGQPAEVPFATGPTTFSAQFAHISWPPESTVGTVFSFEVDEPELAVYSVTPLGASKAFETLIFVVRRAVTITTWMHNQAAGRCAVELRSSAWLLQVGDLYFHWDSCGQHPIERRRHVAGPKGNRH
jgi:hypothetical protein